MPDIDKNILKSLINEFSEETPYALNEKYQDHLLDQYKLFVEMADRISSRRQTANSFFLSINTALIGLLGYFGVNDSPQLGNSFNWIIAIAGITLSYLWYEIIQSHRNLNTAKFNVIHKIEKFLPLSLYEAEWEAVGRGKNSKLYLPFTRVEKGVPWVFVILHSMVLLLSVPCGVITSIIS